MIPIGISGGGYTAAELVRVLSRHRKAKVATVFSTGSVEKGFAEV